MTNKYRYASLRPWTHLKQSEKPLVSIQCICGAALLSKAGVQICEGCGAVYHLVIGEGLIHAMEVPE
jgi:hypothetical protein